MAQRFRRGVAYLKLAQGSPSVALAFGKILGGPYAVFPPEIELLVVAQENNISNWNYWFQPREKRK